MTFIAYKIPVIESEAGWGRKIDDWMICSSYDNAMKFKSEFNSKNTEDTTPDWYMQVEGEPEVINLTESQFTRLQEVNRMWLSSLI